MTIWLDAHLSPALAEWMCARFDVSAVPVRNLGLRSATDKQTFEAAAREDAIVMTKDSDFAQLLDRLGSPPRVIW